MMLIFEGNLYCNLLIFIAISIGFTWFFTQGFKVFLKCWIGRKFSLKMIFADGDFPSTHTAIVTCGVMLILFLNFYTQNIKDIEVINAYSSAKDFLIMFTLASIVIRDAMGQRHRQDNTNKNLKDLKDYVKEFGTERNVVDRIEATFESIDHEAFKRVGHLKHEVLGGLVSGCLCALYPIIYFFDKPEWLPATLITTVVCVLGIMIFLKLKPAVIKRMRYRKSKRLPESKSK